MLGLGLFIRLTMTNFSRVNIGNASLFGLKQDLKLGGNEYNTALVIL